MWLLDEDVLIYGTKDKYGFHPDKNICCGFDLQKLKKRDINKIAFFSFKDAISNCNEKIKIIAGGKIFITYDKGMYMTKYCVNGIFGQILTENLSDDIEKSILYDVIGKKEIIYSKIIVLPFEERKVFSTHNH